MPKAYKLGAYKQDTSAANCYQAGTVLSGANLYSTLERPDGVNLSAVPAGKTWYLTRIMVAGGTAGTYAEIGYGDSAVHNSVSAPTNAQKLSRVIGVAAADTIVDKDIFIAIPAGKYPFIFATGSMRVHVEYVEE